MLACRSQANAKTMACRTARKGSQKRETDTASLHPEPVAGRCTPKIIASSIAPRIPTAISATATAQYTGTTLLSWITMTPVAITMTRPTSLRVVRQSGSIGFLTERDVITFGAIATTNPSKTGQCRIEESIDQ